MYLPTSMEQWCDDTNREEPKYSEKNLFQCYFYHHKSYMKCSGFRRIGTNSSEKPSAFTFSLFHDFAMKLVAADVFRKAVPYLPNCAALSHILSGCRYSPP